MELLLLVVVFTLSILPVEFNLHRHQSSSVLRASFHLAQRDAANDLSKNAQRVGAVAAEILG